jgi:hypothetical protein
MNKIKYAPVEIPFEHDDFAKVEIKRGKKIAWPTLEKTENITFKKRSHLNDLLPELLIMTSGFVIRNVLSLKEFNDAFITFFTLFK